MGEDNNPSNLLQCIHFVIRDMDRVKCTSFLQSTILITISHLKPLVKTRDKGRGKGTVPKSCVSSLRKRKRRVN